MQVAEAAGVGQQLELQGSMLARTRSPGSNGMTLSRSRRSRSIDSLDARGFKKWIAKLKGERAQV